jgi:beta-lactamase class A
MALAVVIAGSPGVALATPVPTVEQRLAELEQANNASIGVYAVNLDTGQTVSHRAQDSFAMLSTFKAYLSGRVLQMAERGDLSLDDQEFVDPAVLVANSPVTEQRAGGQMSVAELCQAALQRSDNSAANILLRRIGGPQAVTDFARSIGDGRSRLDRWETELNSAIPGDLRDTSTPEALGGGYRTLLTGDVLAPQRRQQLDEWMRGNQTSTMRAGLPAGWTSADKTGSGDYGSTNDVGVVYGPGGQRLLVAVMTRSQADEPTAPNMRPLIGDITAAVVSTLLA